METIRVRVLCFSHVRAVLARSEMEIELPAGATAGDAAARLVEMGEGRLDGLPMKIAVNQTFVESDAALQNGDEVAVIPPVQGGAPPVRVVLTTDPLPPHAPDPARDDVGAEIIFHGRVRAGESGREIVALHYEQYEGMAHAELERLSTECVSTYGLTDLVCLHRTGDVAVGEASLRVVIRSRHRAEGLAALDWFLAELKTRVPIWKWGVGADGSRFPSSGAGAAGAGEHVRRP